MLNLSRVMIAYATGDLIIRVVMVEVSVADRECWKKCLQKLRENILPFLSESVAQVPRLGKGRDPCYGYAGEHHTLAVWCALMRSHAKMIKTEGTAPVCRILTTFMVSLWNRIMSGADTARNCSKETKYIMEGDQVQSQNS